LAGQTELDDDTWIREIVRCWCWETGREGDGGSIVRSKSWRTMFSRLKVMMFMFPSVNPRTERRVTESLGCEI
jgi:hypothetical protein